MPVFELLRKDKKLVLFLLLTGDIALICILHTGKALNQGNISSFYVSPHSQYKLLPDNLKDLEKK